MDVYIRKRLDDCLFNYDWYACRWAWKIDEPGGGISICRVAKMIEILKEHKPNKFKQFFVELINKLDKKMEEKSKASCCAKPSDKADKTCCS